MRPPYHPDHVETVVTPLGATTVLARCSCGWSGHEHRLGVPGAARLLADDLNGHRVTYLNMSGGDSVTPRVVSLPQSG